MSTDKRTQAERRTETRAQLLDSASRLFGERGYSATALDDIAEDCALTIRPIYYHFGSKRALFRAVNELMEQRALDALDCNSSVEAWESLLELCKDPAFQRVIFDDAPDVLGRDRWTATERLSWQWSRSLKRQDTKQESANRQCAVMSDRVALAALLETAMYIIEGDGDAGLRLDAVKLLSRLLPDVESTLPLKPCSSPKTRDNAAYWQ